MQPEKLDLSSATISEEKLAQLRDLLPEIFHEGKINFDELKNALGEYVEDDPANERFGLRWPGKSKLQQVINTPSVGTLVPQPEESVDWDDTGNIIIEGDNLEVLKLLQKSYAGKVKMIYIDPPYNTGNDFVYPDKYASGLDTYLEFTGQKDENGQKLASNSDTSGRYHANWLNMMYPRLYLARNLLRQDGVIFVSIDDAEVVQARGMLNIVFGEENFVESLIWKRRYGGGAKEKEFVSIHEYVLVYSRSRDNLGEIFIPMSDDAAAKYYTKVDPERGPFRYQPLEPAKSMDDRPNLNFALEAPDGSEIWPQRQWLWGRDRFQMGRQNGELEFEHKSDGKWVVRRKQFLNEDEGNRRDTKPLSIIEGHYSQHGSAQVNQLLNSDTVFLFPKPTGLVEWLASLRFKTDYADSLNKDDIILDFFAGSGTTGHAVMQQNAEDGGNRKYIMVQLPEPMEPKTLDDGTELSTIADIARERVRRAGRKIAEEHPDKDLDTGFRAYRLASSNFQPWDGDNTSGGMMQSARQASFMPQSQQLSLEERILQAADHLNPTADDLAILTELLLKLGEELTVPVEKLTLADKTVYAIDGNVRLICLEREVSLDVIRQMAAREPGEIICLDAGFADDQTKVNAGRIIATQAQHIEGAIAFKVV